MLSETAVLDTFDRLWPGSSEKDRDALLWSGTEYPFVADLKEVVQSLEHLHAKHGSDIQEVLNAVDQELDLAVQELKDAGNWPK